MALKRKTTLVVTVSETAPQKRNIQKIYEALMTVDWELAEEFKQRAQTYPSATTEVLAGEYVHLKWTD